MDRVGRLYSLGPTSAEWFGWCKKQNMKTNCEIRTEYGVMNIWQSTSNEWGWTLGGNEGRASSFAEAEAEALASMEEVEQ